jgi:hypothetical protein
MANEVVAHYLDHRVVKGHSLDVDPTKPAFHVRTAHEGVVEVKLADLKALFFVRDLAGNPARQDAADIETADARARGAVPIEVEFVDGEQLRGLTVRYPPVKPFFFILPADGASNNIRILVNRGAVRAMRQPGTT